MSAMLQIESRPLSAQRPSLTSEGGRVTGNRGHSACLEDTQPYACAKAQHSGDQDVCSAFAFPVLNTSKRRETHPTSETSDQCRFVFLLSYYLLICSF